VYVLASGVTLMREMRRTLCLSLVPRLPAPPITVFAVWCQLGGFATFQISNSIVLHTGRTGHRSVTTTKFFYNLNLHLLSSHTECKYSNVLPPTAMLCMYNVHSHDSLSRSPNWRPLESILRWKIVFGWSCTRWTSFVEQIVYPGYEARDAGHLAVVKTLYGLEQSGRQWYQRLSFTLTSLGFTRCSIDQAVFFKSSE
jgi:hypothetical protein